jgi:hypothetical protein
MAKAHRGEVGYWWTRTIAQRLIDALFDETPFDPVDG